MRCIAILLSLVLAPAASAGTAVDLKLVLAIDASGSVDEREYALQLGGIAKAFRDPAVHAAIKLGANGRIAVNALAWAEHQMPKQDLGWFEIASKQDAETFAAAIENMGRTADGATGMGEGLAAALRVIEDRNYASERLTVDISGDGAETPARDFVVLMPQARGMARSRNVTVNGLAILGSEEGLEEWYRQNVLTGHDSFLELAEGYEDFARAMRRKLLREIDPRPKMSSR